VRRLSVASLDSGAGSPVYGEEPSAAADHMDPEVKPRWVGDRGNPSLQVPQGGLTCDITVAVSRIPGQAGAGTSRLTTSCDMSVVDQQTGRWYVKDIRASIAADGNPMTSCASSWAVPRGSRSPRKPTDVHGREG
jgi:hypothetical protein